MRLTKYEPSDESMFPYRLKDEELSTELDSIHKLGQLEDILEKYKIENNDELEILCKYAESAREWMLIYKEKMLEIRRIEDKLGIDLITLFYEINGTKAYEIISGIADAIKRKPEH